MYNFRSFDPFQSDNEILALTDLIAPIRQLPEVHEDKKIVAYGCGDLGRMCKEFCLTENIEISAFVDANFERIASGPYWQNENVKPLEFLHDLSKEDTIILVCVVNYPLEEIFDFIKSHGLQNVMTFYDFAEVKKEIYPLANGWLADAKTFDRDRVQSVATLFDDPKSMQHYFSFLAWRYSREEWKFEDAPVQTDNRFFIEEISDYLSGLHTLVDVGAHFGSIPFKLANYQNCQLEKVYCFEPDVKNREQLISNLRDNLVDDTDFEVFEDVLWSRREEIKFVEGFNYASSIAPHGNIRNAQVLDAYNLAPTILKIHTEGSELEIIRGGLHTIANYRPLIMLTVYHNTQGIYETMEYLGESLVDYKFIFRSHSWAGTGAVIYGMPQS